jgi:Putative  PD-(D/E)XK family member, (DUF4420)
MARPIPNSSHKLARSIDGAANVLLRVEGSAWPAPIVLENLSVRYNLRCEIVSRPGDVSIERFTVISCVPGDQLLTDYFLRVSAIVLDAIGDRPTVSEVRDVVDRLVELLRSLALPPTRTIFGLWAELYVISRSKDVRRMASAWHHTPGDLYDFAVGNQRLEVKATGSGIRRHHFSLEQLLPPKGVILLVASVIVERSSGGVSVMDLIDSVRSHLASSPRLALDVERIAATTLGSDWRTGHLDQFDPHIADSSLRFLAAEAIPKVSPGIPPEVSEVHFVVDLASVPEYPAAGMIGELFGAIER